MSDSTTAYRTGAYLIFDNDPERPAKDGNFRSGRALDPPLRASGSQQLDATVLADVVNRIADSGPELRRLLIVDLRQESHAFLDGRAVSWCADKDWSNVGQPPAWITRDEQCQLEKLAAAPDTLVYAVHKDADGNLQILGSRPLHVTRAETEEMVVERIENRLAISYLRLHVTDHCAPEDDAMRTFLTLYDMLGHAKTRPPVSLPPDLEYFRNRQQQIFHYDLKPNPSVKRWQAPLSEIRWRRLESFRRYVFGDYAAGRPSPGFSS